MNYTCAANATAANAWASNFGPVTYDTKTELDLLRNYFDGITTPYRLSEAEMGEAQAYVQQFGSQVLGGIIAVRPDGLVERNVAFGKFASAAPSLDALLGTATEIFSSTELVGLRDGFNFDFKGRGYADGWLGTLGVAQIRAELGLAGTAM